MGKQIFLRPIDKKNNFEVITKHDDGKITKELNIKKEEKGEKDGENSKV